MNILLIIIFFLILFIIVKFENFDQTDQKIDLNKVEYSIVENNINIFDNIFNEINSLHIKTFNTSIHNYMDYFVLAKYNNKIIGFCFLKKISNYYESAMAIYSLCVDENYRKYGIGTNILNIAKQFVEPLNLNIILGINNYDLIPFYERNGFYGYGDNGYNLVAHPNSHSHYHMRNNINGQLGHAGYISPARHYKYNGHNAGHNIDHNIKHK